MEIERGEVAKAAPFVAFKKVGPPLSADRIFLADEHRKLLEDSSLPNIVLCGLPRSGKTSILRVVYGRRSPHETLYLGPTSLPHILKVANSRFVQFAIIDLPGTLILSDTSPPQTGGTSSGASMFPAVAAGAGSSPTGALDETLLAKTQSLVFVIDVQNEPYSMEIAFCKDIFISAWKANPKIHLEVFIHKVDGDFFAVDEIRSECQRDIHDKLLSALHEENVTADVVFYSTSIYDQTIHEALSRVTQRVVPQIPVLQQLMDVLSSACRIEKLFLLDAASKTFIATDSSPFNPILYELCTEMIDLQLEVASIYRPKAEGSFEDTKPLSCVIQLSSGHVLYLYELEANVDLAAVIREEFFDRQFLIDFNIRAFRDAMFELFDLPMAAATPQLPSTA